MELRNNDMTTMKKTTTISGSVRRCATAALTALLLVACTSDDANAPAAEPVGKEIILTATMADDGATTRTTTDNSILINDGTQLPAGEAVDVYISNATSDAGTSGLLPTYYVSQTSGGMYAANDRIQAVVSNTNSQLTLGGGNIRYYWPEGNTAMNIYAFWPAGLFGNTGRATATSTISVSNSQGNNTAPTLTAPAAVKGKPADILYAVQPNAMASPLAVPLPFRRIMAKVTVTLMPGTNTSVYDLENAAVYLYQVYLTATLTAKTAEWSDHTDYFVIAMKSDGNPTLTHCCLLPPQTLSAAYVKVMLDANTSLIYNIPSQTLINGQNLHLMLTVNQ